MSTKVLLKDLIKEDRRITYGVVKPGPEDESGVTLVRGGDIKAGKVQLDGLRTITEEVSRSYRRTLLRGGELLISLVGNPGEVAIASDTLKDANIARQVGLIPLDKSVNSKYVMYYLMSPQGRSQLFMRTQGVVQQVINLADIKKVPIPIITRKDQDRIASILSAYDDLIENNRRRIALLEEAARQLYKEWFVRFRYPGHEHVPIVDGVPEGWEYCRLIDLAEITMGQSPKSEFYNNDGNGLPFHQGVTNFGFRFVSHKTYCTKPIRLSQAGDILFSVRAPVGRINMCDDQIVLGRGLSAMRSRTGHQSFLFYQLKSFFFKENMVGGGAIYAAVNKKQLENSELLCPSSNMIEQFNDFASSIDWQIKILTQSIAQLAKARDLLLPKLMNGEIAV